MKTNNLHKIFLFPLFAILFLSFVAAANTINITHPAQDASISGTYVLSATLDTNTLNLTRANFYYYDTSWHLIAANVSNITTTMFNYSWVTTAFVDVNNWVINVTVSNQTYAIQTTDNSTGVDIDNGDPTASWSSTSISNNYDILGTTTFTLGLSADSTIGISSCTIFCTDAVNSTIYVTTTTTSGNACSNTTLTPAGFPLAPARAYNCLVEAIDGNSDKTNSSSRLLTYKVAETGTLPGAPNIPNIPNVQPVVSKPNAIINFFSTAGNSLSEFILNVIGGISRGLSNLFNSFR